MLGPRQTGKTTLAAKDNLPGMKDLPRLFEQFIGLEILKIITSAKYKSKLLFWRDHAGPEIDYILMHEKKYIPIEVKWSMHPDMKDIKHIKQFTKEYNVEKSFVICRTPRAYDIDSHITAIPWQELEMIFQSELN